MAEVQSIGVVDYSQQYPAQYQDAYVSDVNTMPEVYNEQPAPKKRKGGLLLSLAAIGAAVYVGTKIGGKNATKELEALKNSEAVKNYEGLKTAFEGMKDSVKEIEKETDDIINRKFGFRKSRRNLAQKIREKFIDPMKKSYESIEKAGKEAAEEAGEAAENAAKDAAKDATNAAK